MKTLLIVWLVLQCLSFVTALFHLGTAEYPRRPVHHRSFDVTVALLATVLMVTIVAVLW